MALKVIPCRYHFIQVARQLTLYSKQFKDLSLCYLELIVFCLKGCCDQTVVGAGTQEGAMFNVPAEASSIAEGSQQQCLGFYSIDYYDYKNPYPLASIASEPNRYTIYYDCALID